MTTLSFLTTPATPRTRDVGNDDSGRLRFRVLGGLTVHESIVYDELVSERPNAFVEAAKVADAIAVAEKITRVEAFTVIEKAVGGVELEDDAQSLRLRYAQAINAVIHIFSTSNQYTKEAAVTALIRCRQDQSEWSVADTRTLHCRLLNDIYALYLDEIEAEAVPSASVSEEDLGKPQPDSGPPVKRTGRKSPTACSITSPASTTEAVSASN